MLNRKLRILNKRNSRFELKMKILTSLVFASQGLSRELRFKKRFAYPDPVLDRESLFCPIDELLANSAIVEVLPVQSIQFFVDDGIFKRLIQCTNSAFSGSKCRFSCPEGLDLLGPGDGIDECSCDETTGECSWIGSTRFSDCYEQG